VRSDRAYSKYGLVKDAGALRRYTRDSNKAAAPSSTLRGARRNKSENRTHAVSSRRRMVRTKLL